MSTATTPTRPTEAPFDAEQGSAPAGSRRRGPIGRRLVLGVLTLGALAAAAVLLFFAAFDNGEQLEIGKPKVVTVEQLRSYAENKGAPVYWAGPPAAGFKLELTEVKGGRTFVRYLTADAQAGDPRPAFTTIATYVSSGAYATTKGAATREGAVLSDRGSDGVVLYYKKAPANVYVAKPSDPNRLIEVYAPAAQAAQALAASDQLAPVR